MTTLTIIIIAVLIAAAVTEGFIIARLSKACDDYERSSRMAIDLYNSVLECNRSRECEYVIRRTFDPEKSHHRRVLRRCRNSYVLIREFDFPDVYFNHMLAEELTELLNAEYADHEDHPDEDDPSDQGGGTERTKGISPREGNPSS